MKRIAIFLMSVLATLVVIGAGAAVADEGGGMVAGAGTGLFPAGAVFAGISLGGLDFGQGVLTAPDGTATGTFHAVLQGGSLVTVEGTVTTGAVAGTAIFGGTATVNLGDGTLPLTGLPFQVAVSPDGLQLTLDGALLPTVALSAGAIAIE